MPFKYVLEGGVIIKITPFKIGDKVCLKPSTVSNAPHGAVFTVGDDWEELLHWFPTNGDRRAIVTTCGRVFSVDDVELAK